MSRHRDVRCMNYSDEYDGYDDVYGHSVEDDYCVSPSAEQFLFDRSKQQNIASFITEPDIVEDNEDIDESSSSFNEDKYNLPELEKAKLISCLEAIKNVIGDTVSESKLKEKIIASNFDTDVALDAILKESSPKNDPVISKERLERYPGVSIDKPNTFMFTIPKLSFEKKDNLFKESTSTVYCYPNNRQIDSLSDEKRPFGTFSSLAGLTSHHTESVHSDTTKISPENNTDAQCFGSLAALTTHHLQNSNAINVEFREKEQLPNSQFVIPKLSIKKNDNADVNNIQSLELYNNSKRQPVHANSKHPINLLERNFSDMYISLENNDVTNVESKQFKDPNVINKTRTPSPDNWMIDLSTALKEAEFLTNCTSTNANLTVSKKFYYDMPNLEICIEDNSVISNTLPVTLNLCALRHIKLPHTKKNVSVFGRTLCRKWKTRKPVLKILVQHYNTVKSFDFSTPYQSTNRS